MRFGTAASSPFVPVFVGGAPRSGTTMLHDLVCTSPEANDYVGECSYLSHLIRGYGIGIQMWDTHTLHYFDSQEQLLEYHAALTHQVLHDIHAKLGSPSFLVLKDPLLTARFGIVAMLLPKAKFIVTVRDPRDVVASRMGVFRRQQESAGTNEVVTQTQIEAWCREYNATYAPFSKGPALFTDRIFVTRYESLVDPVSLASELERLSAVIGVPGIDPQRLWGERAGNVATNHPWGSPLYGRPMSDASIGRYVRDMDEDVADLVWRWCVGSLEALGMAETYPSGASSNG